MKIKIGKYVNTHGIKGEIRIKSDFSRKDLIFVPNFKIYICNKEYIINNYRIHKDYDMVTLKGINNINDIINLKGNDVYIEKNDINDTFLEEDLKEYKVIINNIEYKIKDIINNYMQKIILLDNNSMIPFVDDFIINKDNDKKVIYMNVPKDLL